MKPASNPTIKLTYTYDDKMNRTAENRYTLDGILLHQTKFSYTYDDSGKLLKWKIWVRISRWKVKQPTYMMWMEIYLKKIMD